MDYKFVLCSVLNCGYLDLNVLEDINEDIICEALERLKGNGEDLNINSLMFYVFEIALNEFQSDVENSIEELKEEIGDYENEEEIEYREKMIEILKTLDVYEDFQSFHNYIDTSIWFCGSDELKETLQKYCSEAIKNFEDNTGFSLMD